MKVLIAPDSWKGSLSAAEVCGIVGETIACMNKKGLLRHEWNYDICPLADGGEGTVDALVSNRDGKRITQEVHGPLGASLWADYGVIDDTTAVIEMATASGLGCIAIEKRNPLKTSTYGVGELMLDALNRGCTSILMGIGGSATNDGGMGMLRALGYRFYDAQGIELMGIGADLGRVACIDDMQVIPAIKEKQIKLRVACDVNNPLYGERGATYVYARQKGADDEALVVLEAGMQSYARVVADYVGTDYAEVAGAGAAGGLGFALLAYLGAELCPGFDIVSEAAEFEARIAQNSYDLIFTGEGQMNFQSAMGKLPQGVSRMAKKYNLPVVALVGGIDKDYEAIYEHGLTSVFAAVDGPMSLKTAIEDSERLLSSLTERVVRLLDRTMSAR